MRVYFERIGKEKDHLTDPVTGTKISTAEYLSGAAVSLVRNGEQMISFTRRQTEKIDTTGRTEKKNCTQNYFLCNDGKHPPVTVVLDDTEADFFISECIKFKNFIKKNFFGNEIDFQHCNPDHWDAIVRMYRNENVNFRKFCEKDEMIEKNKGIRYGK